MTTATRVKRAACCPGSASPSCCRCGRCSARRSRTDLPSPAQDLGGVAPLRARALLQGRRDEPGHRPARLLLARARGQGLPARAAHRHADRLPARAVARRSTQSFDPIIQFLRPISPLAWLPLGLVIFQQSEPAAVFTIALCAMWPTVINTAVGVRSISQDYLNVGPRAEAVALEDADEDHRPRLAALRLHGLPALARPRLARDRRRRDADRHARRRRLPLAGVQQPRLLAHHPERHHDRRHRLRARPPDGRWSRRASRRAEWRSSRSAALESRTSPAARDHARPRRASTSPLERGRVRGHRRLLGLRQDHARVADRRAHRARRAASIALDGARVTEPGPERGIVFQQYSLLPWMTVLENVALAVDAVNAGRPAARAPPAHRGADRAREPRARAATSGRASSRAACASAWRWRAGSPWQPKLLLMDEPFSALDALTRATLQDELLADLERAALDRDPGHQRRRRGDPARRPHLSDDAGPGRRARAAPSRSALPRPRARRHMSLTPAYQKARQAHRGVPAQLPAPGRRLTWRPSSRSTSLGKTYPTPRGPAVIVRDFTLDVGEGEFVCLARPFRLRQVHRAVDRDGAEHADARGGVIIGGREIDGPGTDRGVVFQSATLLPWLSVRDNVRLALDQVRRAARARAPETPTSRRSGLGGSRRAVPARAVGGHAAARRHRARVRARAAPPAARRAVLAARRAHPHGAAGRADRAVGAHRGGRSSWSPTTSTRRCCSPTAS